MNVLQESVLPRNWEDLDQNSEFYSERNGAPVQKHRRVSAYFDENLPNRWAKQRDRDLRYLDLTSRNIFLQGYFGDVAYARKPTTLEGS